MLWCVFVFQKAKADTLQEQNAALLKTLQKKNGNGKNPVSCLH